MKTKHILLLIIRLLVGGMITYAGAVKFMNMDATITALGSMGLSPTVVWIVAIGEVVAGLAVLLGIFTQIAAAGTAIIMAGAVYYTGGKMMDAIFLLIGSLILIYSGSGKFAVKPCPTSIKDLEATTSTLASTTTPTTPQA